jgi:uncharacterized small protein (DUF1192 family)
MTDLDTLITDLRAKAEAAEEPQFTIYGVHAVQNTFREAANPAAILKILDALEEARIELENAVDHINEVADDRLGWKNQCHEAEAELATLRAEVARLEAENFTLAAGVCVVDGGLIGDEGGTPYCTLRAEVERLRGGLKPIAIGYAAAPNAAPPACFSNPPETTP